MKWILTYNLTDLAGTGLSSPKKDGHATPPAVLSAVHAELPMAWSVKRGDGIWLAKTETFGNEFYYVVNEY